MLEDIFNKVSFDSKITRLKKQISKDPLNGSLLNSLGDLYMRKGGAGEEAAESYRKAIGIYISKGEEEKAVAITKKSISNDLFSTALIDEIVDQLISRNFKEDAVYVYLHLAYKKLHSDLDVAYDTFKKILSITPNNVEARSFIKKMDDHRKETLAKQSSVAAEQAGNSDLMLDVPGGWYSEEMPETGEPSESAGEGLMRDMQEEEAIQEELTLHKTKEDGLSQEITALKEERADTEALLSMLAREKKVLSDELEELKNERERHEIKRQEAGELEKRIEELNLLVQSGNRQKEEEVSALSAELSQKTALVNDMSANLLSMQKTISELNQMLSQMKERSDKDTISKQDADNRLKEMEAELEIIVTGYKEGEAEQKRLKDEIDALSEQIGINKEERNGLLEHAEALKEENRTLEAQINESKEQEAKLIRSVEALDYDKTVLMNEVEALRVGQEDSGARISQLETDKGSLEDEIRTLSSDKEALRESLEAIILALLKEKDAQKEAAEELLREVEEKAKQKENEYVQLDVKYKSAQEEHEKFGKEIEDLNRIIEASSEEKKALLKTIDRLKEESATLDRELEGFKRLQDEFSLSIEKLQAEKNALTSELEPLRSDLQQRLLEVGSYLSEKEALILSLQQRSSTFQNLINRRDTEEVASLHVVEEWASEIQEELSALDLKYRQGVDEREHLEAEIGRLDREIRALQEKNSDLNEEVMRSAHLREEFELRLLQYGEKEEKLIEELKSVTHDAAVKNAEIASLKEELTGLSKRCEVLSEYELKEKEFLEKSSGYAETQARLESEISNLTVKLDEKMREASEFKTLLDTTCSEDRQKEIGLNERIFSLTEESDRLRQSNEEYKDRFDKALEEQKKLEEKVAELLRGMETLERDNHEFALKREALERSAAMQKDNYEAEFKGLLEKINAHQETIASLISLKDDLQQRLSQSETMQETLQSRLAEEGEKPIAPGPVSPKPTGEGPLKRRPFFTRQIRIAYAWPFLVIAAIVGLIFVYKGEIRTMRPVADTQSRKISMSDNGTYQEIFDAETRENSSGPLKLKATSLTHALIAKQDRGKNLSDYDFANFYYFKVSVEASRDGLPENLVKNTAAVFALTDGNKTVVLATGGMLKGVRTIYRQKEPVSLSFICAFPKKAFPAGISNLGLTLKHDSTVLRLDWKGKDR